MTYAFEILHNVVSNWINDGKLVNINRQDYLNDDRRMAKNENNFTMGSKGLIKGEIGALNGWLVKIKQPTKI